MTMVYMYRAALYCTECGESIRRELNAARLAPGDVNDESSYDSDDYPKGPYSDGGGEVDTPQHCDACGVFLENSLTGDGYEYMGEALADFQDGGRGCARVLDQWADFYGAEFLSHASVYRGGVA